MKILFFYFAIFSACQLGFSQNSADEKTLMDSELIATAALNSRYINVMQFEDLAGPIKDLQSVVSQYNFKSRDENEGFPSPFQINFKTSKGSIIASYDQNGKILETIESFNDVKLPEAVRSSIFKRYPGWSLLKADYFAHYTDGSKKVQYKVIIAKKSKQREFKVNEYGKVL